MRKISIIGGDARFFFVKDSLFLHGFDVKIWGLGDRSDGELCDVMGWSDTVIFPLPVSRDKIRLNAPFLPYKTPKLTDICKYLDSGKHVFGGQIPEDMQEELQKKGIKTYDYFLDECLTERNALLTAEAAIEIAMRELPITLDSSRSMVIGYGRIGKLLTNLLSRMNSRVTVAARKKLDRVIAECFGASSLDISDVNTEPLLKINDGYDIVFNTVPARIFDDNIIYKLKKDVCIIDLASPPGGIDIRSARDAGLNVIWALSLPGKHSPKKAGEIIFDSIYTTMKEEGIC